jgi:peptidoglycan hydrolase-like protein with peptidoglycan-binding domain
VRLGTGFHRPGGSERVREVQRQLWNLGFRPGPIDGLYGPQTLAAVKWFQIKHGFRPTGVVDLGTLALLRERTGAAPAGSHTSDKPVRAERPAARGAAPQPQPAAQPAEGGQKQAGEHSTVPVPVQLIAVALLLLAAPLAFTAVRRTRRSESPKPRRPTASRERADGPALRPQPDPPPSREQPIAIGYVRSSRDHSELARHAGTIRQACTARGWKLGELVRDDQAGPGPTRERPGFAAAMTRLSGPGEVRLVVSKLAHLSRSAKDLTGLFEWFAENEVQVIAADAGIDTTTPEGRQAAGLLLAKVARRQAAAKANGHNGGHPNGNGKHANGNTHPGAGGKLELAGTSTNGKGDPG